jgi:hypothetical protein
VACGLLARAVGWKKISSVMSVSRIANNSVTTRNGDAA